jgi:hypothetical protein
MLQRKKIVANSLRLAYVHIIYEKIHGWNFNSIHTFVVFFNIIYLKIGALTTAATHCRRLYPKKLVRICNPTPSSQTRPVRVSACRHQSSSRKVYRCCHDTRTSPGDKSSGHAGGVSTVVGGGARCGGPAQPHDGSSSGGVTTVDILLLLVPNKFGHVVLYIWQEIINHACISQHAYKKMDNTSLEWWVGQYKITVYKREVDKHLKLSELWTVCMRHYPITDKLWKHANRPTESSAETILLTWCLTYLNHSRASMSHAGV